MALSTQTRQQIENDLQQLAGAFGRQGDLLQRAVLELLAAHAVAGREEIGVDEALDVVGRGLNLNMRLAAPEHEPLKQALERRLERWQLDTEGERLAAAALLRQMERHGELGAALYPAWLADPLHELADPAYPLLFVDLGRSQLLPQMAGRESGAHRPSEFIALDAPASVAQQARLLLALIFSDLEKVRASVQAYPAAAGDEALFPEWVRGPFGAVYLNLVEELGQPRVRRQLSGRLPRFLLDNLSAEGRAVLLAPASLLDGRQWRSFREAVADHLHLEAIVQFGDSFLAQALARPALVLLRRPNFPRSRLTAVFAPIAAEEEMPSPERLLRGLVHQVREARQRARETKTPQQIATPSGFFQRPMADLAGRWDPKFNSPERKQLQDALVENEKVAWLESVTRAIVRGPDPAVLRPYVKTGLIRAGDISGEQALTGLRVGDEVWLQVEAEDSAVSAARRAVRVERRSGTLLGYLPEELAGELAGTLAQRGGRYPAEVVGVEPVAVEAGAGAAGSRLTIHFPPPAHEQQGEPVRVVRPRDIVNNRLTGPGEMAWLLTGEEGQRVTADERLQAGDVLLNLYDFSQACEVPSAFEGAIGHRGLALIRPDKEQLDPVYLLSFVLGSEFQQQLDFIAREGRMTRIDPDDLRELLLIVPELGTQRRVAWAFAESQGQLGPEQSGGVEDSLRLAQDQLPGHWLASSLLSSFFSDWDQIQSLQDWLRIKGGYVHQLRNAIVHGGTPFEEDALNEAVLSLEALREVIARAYAEQELKRETRQQMVEALADLRRHAGEVSNAYVRRRLLALGRMLAGLFQTEPVTLPLGVRLERDTLPAERRALLQLRVQNVAGETLHDLLILPHFSSGEVLEQPQWRAPRLAPDETWTFEASLRFGLPSLVRLSGEVRYTLGGKMDVHALPVMTLEVVAPDQLPFEEIRPNPYITGGPVVVPEMFFGRDDVLSFLQDSLLGAHQNNVIILQGNRRTGKSSILKQIIARDLFAPHLPVYVDCQGWARPLDTPRFFYSLARDIRRALRRRDDVPTPAREELAAILSAPAPFYAFQDLLEDVVPPGRTMILMIDEFEIIDLAVQAGELDNVVLENLRHLLQHQRGLTAIFTGSYRLSKLREEYWSILFGIGLKRHVGFLEEGAARRLIVEPVAGRVNYTPEALRRVLELTSAHPYLTQVMGHNVVRQLNRERSNYVTMSIVQEAALETLTSASEQMKHMFDSAGTAAAQALLVFMAQEIGRPDGSVPIAVLEEFTARHRLSLQGALLVAALRELGERDLVRVEGPPERRRYGFRIDLFRQWLRRHQDLQTAVSAAREAPYVQGE